MRKIKHSVKLRLSRSLRLPEGLLSKRNYSKIQRSSSVWHPRALQDPSLQLEKHSKGLQWQLNAARELQCCGDKNRELKHCFTTGLQELQICKEEEPAGTKPLSLCLLRCCYTNRLSITLNQSVRMHRNWNHHDAFPFVFKSPNINPNKLNQYTN